MADGENHAKQIVLGQAKELADKLFNGNAGDTQIQGQAIGLVIQMITPLYEADFMTESGCAMIRLHCEQHQKASHDKIINKIEQIAAIREEKEAETTKYAGATLKLGPLSLKGPVVPIFIILSVLLTPTAAIMYILGRLQSWW